MPHAREMLGIYPDSVVKSAAALAGCKVVCLDCAQSCSACAEACLGKHEVEYLRRCITMYFN